MLRVEHATVRFGERAAVDDVSLQIDEGETVVVLGPSGCGKTTLLRAVAGLQPLDDGRVLWEGDDLADVPAHERRFGLMFQEYALFPHRTVEGNVEFGLRMAHVTKAERAQRVGEVLDLVGLRELRARRVASLSGGEQQRVALARALAVAPRLLMLDEPLGALDREWRERLATEIRDLLARTALPALYVTHDHDEAFALATRVVVMRAGRVVQEGTPECVWSRPVDAWTAAFLGFGPSVEADVVDCWAQTPWGEIALEDRVTSGRVTLVLRPDAVRLEPDGPIDATVAQSLFAGDRTTLVLDTAGPQLQVGVPVRDAPAPGTRVRLTIDASGVLVYPRD
jgi:thiamine transport system ATP-binding protein